MRTAAAEQLRGLCLASATVRAIGDWLEGGGAAASRSPASTNSVLGMKIGGEPSDLTSEASTVVGASMPAKAKPPRKTPMLIHLRRRIDDPLAPPRVRAFPRSAREICGKSAPNAANDEPDARPWPAIFRSEEHTSE